MSVISDTTAWRRSVEQLAVQLRARAGQGQDRGPAAVALAALERTNLHTLDSITSRLVAVAIGASAPSRSTQPVAAPEPGHRLGLGQVLLMPVGDRCNLACTYCYETDRRSARPALMGPAVLDAVLDNLLPHLDAPLQLNVHGGEPLLAGLDFFDRLAHRVATAPVPVQLAIQTNGTLVDDTWARWLRDHQVGVGVSIDGDATAHDALRVDQHGRGSWRAVARGVETLQAADVNLSAIAVFGPDRARRAGAPARLLRAITDLGISHFNVQPSYSPSNPPAMNVDAAGFATFMIGLFDAWLDHGDPAVRIGIFDHIMHGLVGQLPGVCYFSGRCSTIIGVHSDGSVIPCTRPFETRHTFGNLATTPAPDILASAPADVFDAEERIGRPPQDCAWAGICHGGCPHERVDETGQQALDGRHVYCTCATHPEAGYPALFAHIRSRITEVLTPTAPGS